MTQSVPAAGQKVLLVGNPVAQVDDLQKAQENLSRQVTSSGSVVFEQLDRIPHSKHLRFLPIFRVSTHLPSFFVPN